MRRFGGSGLEVSAIGPGARALGDPAHRLESGRRLDQGLLGDDVRTRLREAFVARDDGWPGDV